MVTAPTPIRKLPGREERKRKFSPSDLEFIVKTAKARAALLNQFRCAIAADQISEVMRLGRMISGMDPIDELESDRDSESLDPRSSNRRASRNLPPA